MMDDEQREVLRGQGFVVNEEIGKGSFGIVYRITSLFTHASYAAKVMDLRKLRMQPGFNLKRLLREVYVMQHVEHENIVKLYHTLQAKDSLLLIMELVSGIDLFESIIARAGLDEESAGDIFLQLCCALRYLHGRHIVHRDVKPENVLLHSVFSVSENTAGAHPGRDDRSQRRNDVLHNTATSQQHYSSNNHGDNANNNKKIQPGSTVIKLVDFGLSKVLGAMEEPKIAASHPGAGQYSSLLTNHDQNQNPNQNQNQNHNQNQNQQVEDGNMLEWNGPETDQEKARNSNRDADKTPEVRALRLTLAQKQLNASNEQRCTDGVCDDDDGNHSKDCDGWSTSVTSYMEPGSFVGTPKYLAPEVAAVGEEHRRCKEAKARGEQALVDKSKLMYGTPADCYSAGVVLHVMLGSCFPQFDDEMKVIFRDPRVKDISSQAKDLISHLLIPDPCKRLTMNGALAHPWIAPALSSKLERERYATQGFRNISDLLLNNPGDRGGPIGASFPNNQASQLWYYQQQRQLQQYGPNSSFRARINADFPHAQFNSFQDFLQRLSDPAQSRGRLPPSSIPPAIQDFNPSTNLVQTGALVYQNKNAGVTNSYENGIGTYKADTNADTNANTNTNRFGTFSGNLNNRQEQAKNEDHQEQQQQQQHFQGSTNHQQFNPHAGTSYCIHDMKPVPLLTQSSAWEDANEPHEPSNSNSPHYQEGTNLHQQGLPHAHMWKNSKGRQYKHPRTSPGSGHHPLSPSRKTNVRSLHQRSGRRKSVDHQKHGMPPGTAPERLPKAIGESADTTNRTEGEAYMSQDSNSVDIGQKSESHGSGDSGSTRTDTSAGNTSKEDTVEPAPKNEYAMNSSKNTNLSPNPDTNPNPNPHPNPDPNIMEDGSATSSSESTVDLGDDWKQVGNKRTASKISSTSDESVEAVLHTSDPNYGHHTQAARQHQQPSWSHQPQYNTQETQQYPHNPTKGTQDLAAVEHGKDYAFDSSQYQHPHQPFDLSGRISEPLSSTTDISPSVIDPGQLQTLQVQIEECFSNAYKENKNDPSVSSEIRASAVASRELTQASHKVLSKLEQTAYSVQELLPDLLLAIEEGEYDMAVQSLNVVKQWVVSLKDEAHHLLSANSEVINTVNRCIESARRRELEIKDSEMARFYFESLRIQDAKNPGDSIHSNSTPPSPAAGATDATWETSDVAPDVGRAMNDSTSVPESSSSSWKSEKHMLNLQENEVATNTDTSHAALKTHPIARSEQQGEGKGGGGGGEGGEEEEANALTKHNPNQVSSYSITPTQHHSDSRLQHLSHALAMLSQIDQLLQQHTSFWRNMEVAVEVLLQRATHVESLVNFTQNPRLRMRFRQRVEDYGSMWKRVVMLTQRYDHKQRLSRPLYGFLNDVETS